MTAGEASAVNVIFGYLAGRGDELPPSVVHALEILASRAHQSLGAGVSEVSVRRQWPCAYPAGLVREPLP
jgi:hypothetical protein